MLVTRGFIVLGPLYLVFGLGFGMYMGASGDHSYTPVHAHINLVGFVLSMVFGLTYARFPAAAATMIARAHFWLHQIGSVILVTMLFLLFSGRIAEEAMVPIAPICELAILLGVVGFAGLMFRHAE